MEIYRIEETPRNEGTRSWEVGVLSATSGAVVKSIDWLRNNGGVMVTLEDGRTVQYPVSAVAVFTRESKVAYDPMNDPDSPERREWRLTTAAKILSTTIERRADGYGDHYNVAMISSGSSDTFFDYDGSHTGSVPNAVMGQLLLKLPKSASFRRHESTGNYQVVCAYRMQILWHLHPIDALLTFLEAYQ